MTASSDNPIMIWADRVKAPLVHQKEGADPAAVVFDATRPSPDPTTPSCAIEYECYEGMLVAAAGLVVGPSQTFGTDPIAEFHAIATAGPAPMRDIAARCRVSQARLSQNRGYAARRRA